MGVAIAASLRRQQAEPARALTLAQKAKFLARIRVDPNKVFVAWLSMSVSFLAFGAILWSPRRIRPPASVFSGPSLTPLMKPSLSSRIRTAYFLTVVGFLADCVSLSAQFEIEASSYLGGSGTSALVAGSVKEPYPTGSRASSAFSMVGESQRP